MRTNITWRERKKERTDGVKMKEKKRTKLVVSLGLALDESDDDGPLGGDGGRDGRFLSDLGLQFVSIDLRGRSCGLHGRIRG